MSAQEDHHLRILCVEDDPLFQRVLKLALGSYGFEVTTASNGIAALAQYKTCDGQFECILSDHDMPEMNGLQFVASVRTLGYEGRIVLMSELLTYEAFQGYAPFAISGFFHKPFEVGMLASLLLEAN